MSTIAALVKKAKLYLRDCGVASYVLDSELLVLRALRKEDRAFLFLNAEAQCSFQEVEELQLMLEQRASGMPVSRILGYKNFWKETFHIEQYAFSPRPETEIIVESCLKYINRDQSYPNSKEDKINLLDLGTGSGCILLSLLLEHSGAYGIGIDIDERALIVARKNANCLELSHRVHFMVSDWFTSLPQMCFDIIVCNPPYISLDDLESLPLEVKDHDPKIALTDFADGLTYYRCIAERLPFFLKNTGIAVFEIGIGQSVDVTNILETNGVNVIAVEKDLAGIDRVIIATKV